MARFEMLGRSACMPVAKALANISLEAIINHANFTLP